MVRSRINFHPWRVFTYLSILGISSAFITLISGLTFTWISHPLKLFSLPSIFHANTFLMLLSSYSVIQVKNALQSDDHRQFRFHIWITVGLGFIFAFFQLLGWRELSSSGVNFKDNIAGTYIYLLSGLHIAHLMVGIVWLAFVAFRNTSIENDALKLLLFETNPEEKLKIEMAILYWHFVDVLWLLLYLFIIIFLYAKLFSIEKWL